MYWAGRNGSPPSGDDDQHRHEGGEQDERHRDAVHAEVVVDVEGGIQAARSTNCISRAEVKAGVQRQADQEGGDAKPRRATSSGSRPVAAAKDQHGAKDRQPDGQAQDRQFSGHASGPVSRQGITTTPAAVRRRPCDGVVVEIAGLQVADDAASQPTGGPSRRR